MRTALFVSLFAMALSSGCSTTEPQTRGWVGGVYGTWSVPDSLESGAFVYHLAEDTPGFDAGLRSGDLVVAVDEEPVSSSGEFLGRIESTEPGAPLVLRVYRFGKLEEIAVTTGREVFRREVRSNLRFGLDFDPIPDPSFNILNLVGFRWSPQPVELSQPYWKYYKHQREVWGNFEGVDSRDEWRFTLALVNVAGYRRVLKQERFEVQQTAAPSRRGEAPEHFQGAGNAVSLVAPPGTRRSLYTSDAER